MSESSESIIPKILLYGCYFLVAYLPWQIILRPVEGVEVASISLVVAFLFLMYLVEGKSLLKFQQLGSWLSGSILIFILFCAVSVLFSPQKVLGFRRAVFLINMVLAYPVFLWVFDSHIKAIKLLKVFLWSAIGAVLVALVVFFEQFGYGVSAMKDFLANNIAYWFWGKNFTYQVFDSASWVVNIGEAPYLRAFGLFFGPHIFGLFLGFVLPLAIGFYIFEKKTIYFVMAIVVIVAAYLTFSRAAYLSLLFSLGGALAVFNKCLTLKMKMLLIGLISITMIVFFVPLGPVSERFYSAFDAADKSNDSRLVVWSEAFGQFMTSPIFGVGLGNLAQNISSVQASQSVGAHNTYLEVLAEGGILAFFGWILIVIVTMRSLIKKIISQKRVDLVNFFLLTGFIWFFTFSFFETGLYFPQIAILFFGFLGLAQSYHFLISSKQFPDVISYGIY